MKKSLLIIALFAGISSINANTYENLNTNNESITIKTTYSVSPFCMAIVKGEFETVKKLIDLGEDVNKKSNGLTPLMFAAKYNRVEILELLISKGANLKTKDTKKGYTALKFAELSNAKQAKSVLEKALNA